LLLSSKIFTEEGVSNLKRWFKNSWKRGKMKVFKKKKWLIVFGCLIVLGLMVSYTGESKMSIQEARKCLADAKNTPEFLKRSDLQKKFMINMLDNLDKILASSYKLKKSTFIIDFANNFDYLSTRSEVIACNPNALNVFDSGARKVDSYELFGRYLELVEELCRTHPTAIDEFCGALSVFVDFGNEILLNKYFEEIDAHIGTDSAYISNLCYDAGLCIKIYRIEASASRDFNPFWERFWRVNNALRDLKPTSQGKFLDLLRYVEEKYPRYNNAEDLVYSLYGAGWEWKETATAIEWTVGVTQNVDWGFKAEIPEISGQTADNFSKSYSEIKARGQDEIDRIWDILQVWLKFLEKGGKTGIFTIQRLRYKFGYYNVECFRLRRDHLVPVRY
jgi:hypothetical protein